MRINKFLAFGVAATLGIPLWIALAPPAAAASWGADPFGDQDNFETPPADGWDYNGGVSWYGAGTGSPPAGHDGSGHVVVGGGGYMIRKMGWTGRTDLVISLEFWEGNGGAAELLVVFYGLSNQGAPYSGYAFKLTTFAGASPSFQKWNGANAYTDFGWQKPGTQLAAGTVYAVSITVAGHYLYGYIDGTLVATAQDGDFITLAHSFYPDSSFNTWPFDLLGGPRNVIGVRNGNGLPGMDKFKVIRNTVYVQDQNDKVSLIQDAHWVNSAGTRCNTGTPTWTAGGNEILLDDCAQGVRLQNQAMEFSDFVVEFDFRYKDSQPQGVAPTLDISFGDKPAAGAITPRVTVTIYLTSSYPSDWVRLWDCQYFDCQVYGQGPSGLYVDVTQTPATHHVKVVRSGGDVFAYVDAQQVRVGNIPMHLSGNHVTIWTREWVHNPAQGDGIWIDNVALSMKGQADDFQDLALQPGWAMEQGNAAYTTSISGDTRLILSYPGAPGVSRMVATPPPFWGYSGYRVSVEGSFTAVHPNGLVPRAAVIVARQPTGWLQFEYGDPYSQGGEGPRFEAYTGAETCGAGCGTVVGRDEWDGNYNWGGLWVVRQVVVDVHQSPVTGAYEFRGWINGQLMASYETSGPIYGTFGLVNEKFTSARFNDLVMTMDTDVDGASDVSEMNGDLLVRGVGNYQINDVGKYFLQMPPGATTATPAISALAPRGTWFNLDLSRWAVNNGVWVKALIQQASFAGSGEYSIYKFNALAIDGRDEYYEVKLTGKSFETQDLKVGFFGLLRANVGGVYEAFTTAGDAEGSEPLKLDFAGSSLTYTKEVGRQPSEWEFADFDGDRMDDWREQRMGLRTDIRYGFVDGSQWGANKNDAVYWGGIKYTCKTNAQGTACQANPAGYVPTAGDIIGSLSDGAELRGRRAIQNNLLVTDLVLRDKNHVAGMGGNFFVYQPAPMAQQPWPANSAGSMLDDSKRVDFENSRQLVGPLNSDVTNKRWAFFQYGGDGSGNWGGYRLMDQWRTYLSSTLGLLERDNNASSPDASGFDPYADHILTSWWDGTDTTAFAVSPSNIDFAYGKATTQDVFQNKLAPYVGKNDLVFVYINAHGCIENLGDPCDASTTGSEFYTEGLVPIESVNEGNRIFEADWAANLGYLTRPLQVAFFTVASHGGGILDSLASPQRTIMVSSKEAQSGRVTDNRATNGQGIASPSSCESDWDLGTTAVECDEGLSASDSPEVSYYMYGAIVGKTLYANDVDQLARQQVDADVDHNGLVSLWEAWDYATLHQSHTSTVYPSDSTLWIDPQLDDDGASPGTAPTSYDGLRSQLTYL
jgi:hypothetical protein